MRLERIGVLWHCAVEIIKTVIIDVLLGLHSRKGPLLHKIQRLRFWLCRNNNANLITWTYKLTLDSSSLRLIASLPHMKTTKVCYQLLCQYDGARAPTPCSQDKDSFIPTHISRSHTAVHTASSVSAEIGLAGFEVRL